MKNAIKYIYYYLKSKYVYPKMTGQRIEYYRENEIKYGRHTLLSAPDTSKLIMEYIYSGKPFMAGRYGAVELYAWRTEEFDIRSKGKDALKLLCRTAGFFPEEQAEISKFAAIMRESSQQCDLIFPWYNPMEELFIKQYCRKEVKTSFLYNLEPWMVPDNPWTAALKGKKVLVIHPFSETIQEQYRNHRKEIFAGTDILPEFELYTLKAVQTLAGEKDPRFTDWFEALDWMYSEAMKIKFDIAIIGCGAYGFPLAARLKEAGKQAIHLGGATQLLFGIKGKRWEGNAFHYVNRFFNDKWTTPSISERPSNAETVEKGCYW